VFFLQAADTKAPGGIEAAMRHYHRMFAAMGAPSAALYHGPIAGKLAADGVEVLPFGSRAGLIASSLLPALSPFKRRIDALAKGARIVAIVHSDLLLEPLRRLFPGMIAVTPCHSDKFARKRKADHVITLNPGQYALAQSALPHLADRIHMLGNPFVSATAPSAEVPDGRPFRRVVFCARFVVFKEPMTLLQAYAALEPAMRPPITLYGDGPMLNEARAFAAGAKANAEFPGWTSDPWSEIGPEDLLVTPSNWEGLPYLLLEALSHGVPVLASDIAGNRMALRDGEFGAHFRTSDPADLSRALTWALDHPSEMRAKARAGAASVAPRFGAEAFFGRLAALLKPDMRDRA
jgi:glycosyltransferase involved in cell wall biosynthesis